MMDLKRLGFTILSLAVAAGSAASDAGQVTAGVATAERSQFANPDMDVATLVGMISASAAQAAETVVADFDMQAAMAEAEADIPDTGDASIDRQALLAEYVAGLLAPLLAKAVSDAMADTITQAGASPEVAAAAVSQAVTPVSSNGVMSVNLAVMTVVTNAFGSVFGGNGTNGASINQQSLLILSSQVGAAAIQVQTAVQTVAANNPTPRNDSQPASTETTAANETAPPTPSPPLTVVVVYRAG